MSMDGQNEDGRHRLILAAPLAREGSPIRPGTPSLSSSRVPRRRAPITNVACQECRKRKTKCDGQRPRCSNCAKRVDLACQYDAEGTQSSRLAIYKSRLEKQDARIQGLEEENSRLKEAASHGRSSIQSLSLSSLPQLPPIASSSAASLLFPSISPFKYSHSEAQARPSNQQQEAKGLAPCRSMDWNSLEEELSHNQSQKWMLRNENNRLKELMVLLTLLDDRGVAKRMALRIREEGVTDDLLCEANALVAAGRVMPNPIQNLRNSRTHQLPALSSLELPAASAPYTLDINHEMHARRYPPPPLSLP